MDLRFTACKTFFDNLVVLSFGASPARCAASWYFGIFDEIPHYWIVKNVFISSLY
ncbi:MAG: hypothetical protein ACD_17C00221G0008 [uncultured bacterium]|nr:MAG: hypothetical protein ACD_17C00221G0008 [uncultured bacterium]